MPINVEELFYEIMVLDEVCKESISCIEKIRAVDWGFKGFLAQ